jgi:hypothetical protein
VRPAEPGISAAERSARIAGLLDSVKEIPDSILRHEECRRVAEAVAVPLEVLWDRIKPRTAGAPPRASAGTAPSKAVLPDGGIPDAESALLPILVRGGEHISLILGRLNDDWLSRDGVRAIAAAFRAERASEPVDFQRIIAHLNDDQKNLLAQAVTEEGLEPTTQRVTQVLDKLEQDYLRRESAALLAAIGRSPEDNDLLRKKMATDRRIAELKSSRKGNELGD